MQKNPSSSVSMESRFLRLRYQIFFFLILLISVLFIVTDLNGFSIAGVLLTGLLTVLIFVINFSLGYSFIKIYFLKKSYYQLKSMLLLLSSYLLTPTVLGYAMYLIFAEVIDNSIFNERPIGFVSLVLGINFLANTLLLLFYGSNTTVVHFANEAESRKLFPDLKVEENSLPIASPDNPDQSTMVVAEPSHGNGVNIINPEVSEDEKRYLIFRHNRVLYRIKFSSIVYLEVDLNTVFLQTTKEFYEMRSTLGEIMVGLPNNFFQINKSIAINLDYFDQLVFENETKRSKVKIKFIQEDEEEEQSFYVGRKYLQDLKQILAK